MIRARLMDSVKHSNFLNPDSDGLYRLWIKEVEGSTTFYLLASKSGSASDVTSGGRVTPDNFQRLYVDPDFPGFNSETHSIPHYKWLNQDECQEIIGELSNEHFLYLLKDILKEG